MSHLDEGAILALRDGTLVSADIELHLRDCPECAASLGLARDRSLRVEETLSTLDVDEPLDVEAAKAKVRAALDRGSPTRAPRVQSRHLGRAAAILLISAGAVYAVPGSPLRQWVSSFAGSAEISDVGSDVEGQDPSAGIDVPVADGSIRVSLTSVAPGTTLEVVWIDQAMAQIRGGEGSSYAVARGSAEAEVADGPIRVALPRDARLVTLEVNGRMVLRQSEAGLELTMEPVERSEDRIVFSIPQ